MSQKHALTFSLSRQEQIVWQWRGVRNFVGILHGYPDVVASIKKFDEERVLGLPPFKESAGEMQYWWCKEYMEWLTDALTKKVTENTVNRKWKELRHLQGI